MRRRHKIQILICIIIVVYWHRKKFSNMLYKRKPTLKARNSPHADIIIYNRVPKCASTFLLYLFQGLNKPWQHDFIYENQIEVGQGHYFDSHIQF